MLTRKQKLKRLISTSHNHTVYTFKGLRIFLQSLAAVLKLNLSIVNKDIQQIANGSTVAPYDPAISSNRKNILTQQSFFATTFLMKYGR